MASLAGSPYNFDSQMTKGDRGAEDVIAYLSIQHEWIPATKDEQKKGIDGIAICRKTGRKWAVEIKTDWVAKETGNVFIETVSVDAEGILGWAYTSLAQVLCYYIPQASTMYVVSMARVKARVCEWAKLYPHRSIPNNGRHGGYNTEGLLVPLEIFIEQCHATRRELQTSLDES